MNLRDFKIWDDCCPVEDIVWRSISGSEIEIALRNGIEFRIEEDGELWYLDEKGNLVKT